MHRLDERGSRNSPVSSTGYAFIVNFITTPADERAATAGAMDPDMVLT